MTLLSILSKWQYESFRKNRNSPERSIFHSGWVYFVKGSGLLSRAYSKEGMLGWSQASTARRPVESMRLYRLSHYSEGSSNQPTLCLSAFFPLIKWSSVGETSQLQSSETKHHCLSTELCNAVAIRTMIGVRMSNHHHPWPWESP